MCKGVALFPEMKKRDIPKVINRIKIAEMVTPPIDETILLIFIPEMVSPVMAQNAINTVHTINALLLVNSVIPKAKVMVVAKNVKMAG